MMMRAETSGWTGSGDVLSATYTLVLDTDNKVLNKYASVLDT